MAPVLHRSAILHRSARPFTGPSPGPSPVCGFSPVFRRFVIFQGGAQRGCHSFTGWPLRPGFELGLGPFYGEKRRNPPKNLPNPTYHLRRPSLLSVSCLVAWGVDKTCWERGKCRKMTWLENDLKDDLRPAIFCVMQMLPRSRIYADSPTPQRRTRTQRKNFNQEELKFWH